MFRDAAVKDLPSLVLNHQEHEQYPQADRRYGKEVDRNDLPGMIPQEGPPRLRGWSLDAPQDARHGPLGHFDSELLQLAVNTRRAPQGVCLRQSSNQRANFKADGRPTQSSLATAKLIPLFIPPSKPCRIAPCAAILSRRQDGIEMPLFQCQPTHDRRLHTRYIADCPRSE